MHRFNAFSHSNCSSHTLLNDTNHKTFLSNMICNWSLIHRKFKSVQPKVVFQELNHVLEIPKFHI